MDLQSIVSELHLRGLDQDKVDSALRCLVHVYAVQDSASDDRGGILAEDILNTYQLDVVQAASDLFLEKTKVQGREVFRVKWGCEDAAANMNRELWVHSGHRWDEFTGQLDGRYLGFFLPQEDQAARVTSNWKLGRELKWFSVEIPRQGWKILSIMDDITEVAWKLDLAFGFRPFGPEGIGAPRVLLHERALENLRAGSVPPTDELIREIRLWKFFSEYDVESSDIVALMKDCGLTLENVVDQVRAFFDMGLTSQYRDGQYPPYFVNDKKKKEFAAAVKGLLLPMDMWLSQGKPTAEPVAAEVQVPESAPANAA